MNQDDSVWEVAGWRFNAWQLVSVCVVLAAAVVYLVRLGDRSVISEEFRWAEVAREMRQSGDYFHPKVNGQTYYDKPVGSYWFIVASSYLTGGVDETAARLPAAIAGILGVWVVALLGRQLYDGRTAACAGAILATCFAYAFYARRATADVETVTGVLVAVWLFARHLGRPAGPWLVSLWLWMALVSLTKGLLGFALPVMVFGAYGLTTAWANRAEGWRSILHTNRWLLNRWSLLAVPLGLLVYLLPFVIAATDTGSQVGLEMVWRENIKRFVAPHNHVGPVYLYVGVVFVLAAPWSLFLPAALFPTSRPSTPGDRLAKVYFWAVFLFFTASASRRSYYLLPVLPALALLTARLLVAHSTELTGLARRWRTTSWWVLGAAVVLAGVGLLPTQWILPADVLIPPLPARGWLTALWLGCVATVLVCLLKPNFRRLGVAFAIVFAVFAVGFDVVYPAADELRTRKEFLLMVRERTDAEPTQLALFHASDVVFDLGRITPEFADAETLRAAITAGKTRWVVLPQRMMPMVQLKAAILLEENTTLWDLQEKSGNKLVLIDTAAGPRHE